MTGATAEHTEVVVEAPLSFLLSQLTILTELIGDRGGVAGGRGRRLCGFVVVLLDFDGAHSFHVEWKLNPNKDLPRREA